ncbi:MAG: enoyl-CoA hydratase/isomerase family protein, partial [Proteobacteria bacterium]|nr:enoyl-CoA hydratase/isomerase family protein [Pseudomonadota bacterium]
MTPESAQRIPLHYRQDGDIAVLVIDNPPVNAMGTAVRAAIVEAMARATGDPTVRAIILIGAGRTFIAGADIREFGAQAGGYD